MSNEYEPAFCLHTQGVTFSEHYSTITVFTLCLAYLYTRIMTICLIVCLSLRYYGQFFFATQSTEMMILRS